MYTIIINLINISVHNKSQRGGEPSLCDDCNWCVLYSSNFNDHILIFVYFKI